MRTDTKMRMRTLHIALIVLVGACAYSNTLHVPFVLDDYSTIRYYGAQDLLNILIHGSSRRVVEFTFALNFRNHGIGLLGYHLVNLVIHLSAAVVLYGVICSAISALRVSFPIQGRSVDVSSFIERFIPCATATLFVCHPLQTQAVTYIIQRYTSLASFFYLLSVLFFLRARLACENGGRRGWPWFLGSLSIVTGILALGSKQIAATLPLMLLMLEIILFRGRLLNRRFFIACSALFVVISSVVMIAWRDSSIPDFLQYLHSATVEDPRLSRTAYFMTQSTVVTRYVSLLFLPLGQSLVHDVRISTTLLSWQVIAAFTLHISILAAALIVLRKSRHNLLSGEWEQGVLQRFASMGIFWFYGTLAVESSIIPIRDAMVEHRVYLPSAGFFMAVTACMVLVTHNKAALAKLSWSSLAVVCSVLAFLTFARNQVWNDRLLLWQDAAGKYPDSALALSNLGGEYLVLKMPEKTIPLYVRTMELGGDFQAFYLGKALQALNRFGSRFTTGQEFMRSGGPLGSGLLAAEDEQAYKSVVFNTLALAYEYLGETDKALRSYKRSLQADPAYDLAWYNLALLLNRLGEQEEAYKALSELRKINPELARSLHLL